MKNSLLLLGVLFVVSPIFIYAQNEYCGYDVKTGESCVFTSKIKPLVKLDFGY